ncbi:unnamed protein product [Owenia fusiformis]|uniref:Uncharacterized protein n=1 Tax=Owenia fusiformis TaxID=6347 RepID=A0A8J1TX35_OWEFU|nr:unnamed protein product [Owenia fusiformis]
MEMKQVLTMVLILVLIEASTCHRRRGNRKNKSHKSHKSNKGIVECEPLEAPVNGSLQLINGVAIYSCDKGFVLNGNSTRVCQTVYGHASSSSSSSSHSHHHVTGAEWSGDNTTCEPVDCGNPDDGTNFLSVSYSTTTLGSIATFSCDDCGRFLDDGDPITCLPSGEWSCSRAICRGSGVQWAQRQLTTCTSLTTGTEATVTGLENLGDCQRTCILYDEFDCKSFEWTPGTSSCKLKDFIISDPGVVTDTSCAGTTYREILCNSRP